MHSTDAISAAAQPAISRDRRVLDCLTKHRGLATWAVILMLPLIAVSTGHIFHKSDSGGNLATADLDSIAWPRSIPTTQPPRPSGTSTSSAAPVASLIAGLEQRLASEPADPKGWALLAQSYSFLGDTQRAEAGVVKAVALGLDETELRRRVSLASATPADAEAPDMAQSPGVIRGIVRLAEGNSVSVPPEGRLFVTAKATDGSTTPVAVIVSRVTRFPYQFTLSDDNSMLPGVTLTGFDEIAVSARISLAGTAARSAQDIESTPQIVQVASPGWVELVLEN